MTIAAEDISSRTADHTAGSSARSPTAFGGAIRDMWNPTCYGDPGKVCDAEYNCDPLLDRRRWRARQLRCPQPRLRAARRRWHLQRSDRRRSRSRQGRADLLACADRYLTPSSDFADAADALEAVLRGPDRQADQQADHRAQRDPGRGDSRSLLPTAPRSPRLSRRPRCGPAGASATSSRLFDAGHPRHLWRGLRDQALFTEDFEDGLAGWTASFETAFDGGIHEPWVASTTAPTGNGAPTRAAWPSVRRPTRVSAPTVPVTSRAATPSRPPSSSCPSALRAPKMTFDHYLATEAGYDGGNVKVSVNGGAYEVVPEGAYIYNANNYILQPTNPLGGEEGFSGTDGGEVDGSWVQSQVDLTSLDVSAGDTVQFRFDIGRDGCGGVDGWYIDNVQVIQCQLKSKVSGGAPARALHLRHRLVGQGDRRA